MFLKIKDIFVSYYFNVKNQLLGIFFYLLYLLAMVKPIIPIMEYYANYDYIAMELCENRDKPYLECNGKCYLEKQIKENTPSNHDHNSPIPSIDLKDYPISPLGVFTYNFSSDKPFLTKVSNSSKFFYNQYYSKLLKPPKSIS